MVPERVAMRVLEKVVANGGCLLSTYSVGSHGYAQIGWHDASSDKRVTVCHRVAWEAANGPIPNGLTIDHICRNRTCVNVEHLRLLTNEENGRLNGAYFRTSCPAGHDYDLFNTYVDPKGHRRCRQCAQDRRRKAA